MASNLVMIHKLQHALNDKKGMKIMYSTSQFYSEDQNRPVTIYHIKEAKWDKHMQKWINVELYHATAQIRIVLFLRDLWYTVNGKELPKADEQWEEIRKTIDIFDSRKGE